MDDGCECKGTGSQRLDAIQCKSVELDHGIIRPQVQEIERNSESQTGGREKLNTHKRTHTHMHTKAHLDRHETLIEVQ